jgi:O-antigen ligase
MKITWDKYLYYAQLLVIASLPYHFLISSYAIGLLLLIFLINILNSSTFRKEIKSSFQSNRIAQLLVLLFGVYFISTIIHFTAYDDYSIQSSYLEKNLSFLIFPFLFANIRLYSDKQIRSFFKVYIASILISTLIALIAGLYFTVTTGSIYYYDPDKQSIYNNFMYHRLGSYLGMHGVYYAEYVLLAFILWGSYVSIYFLKWDVKNKAIAIILGLYLIGILILLKSAVILITLLLVISASTVYYLHKAKDRVSIPMKTLIAIIAILLVSFLSYRTINKVGMKADYFTYDITQPGDGEWNSINLRLAKWDVAKMAIRDHWLWGVGPGNTTSTLDEIYKDIGFEYALQLHYNPHNQFLSTFLATGILGVCVITLIYLLSFASGIKKKDTVMVLFILSFFLFSVSESTLVVNKGIVFFSIFFSIFSYLPYKLSHYINESTKG